MYWISGTEHGIVLSFDVIENGAEIEGGSYLT